MKPFKILLIAAISWALLNNKTTAQILNAGLETWYDKGAATGLGSFEEPQDWGTTNYSNYLLNGTLTIFKTTDKHSGIYAMQLKSVNGYMTEAMCGATPWNLNPGDGFALTQRPTAMQFYYKFNFNGNDTGFVKIVLQKSNGALIGMGDFKIASNSSSYTLAEVPIYYLSNDSPNVAYIDVLVGSDVSGSANTGGSILYVDDFSFVGTTGTNDISKQNSFAVYPNPASDMATLKYCLPKNDFVSLRIFDIQGKEINPFMSREEIQENLTIRIDLNVLYNGIYFFELKTNDFVEIKQLVVKH